MDGYEITLFDLLQHFSMVIMVVVIAISWMLIYAKYELKALREAGYMELRLEEAKLKTQRVLDEHKRYYDHKIAKINAKK
jgi:hypothetical protein